MKAIALELVGRRVLVTTEQWFYAPDGRQYKAVVGTLRGVRSAPEVLGIKVNARNVDWYLELGRMVIAGCQIHYAIGVEPGEPHLGEALDFGTTRDADLKTFNRPSGIFDAGK